MSDVTLDAMDEATLDAGKRFRNVQLRRLLITSLVCFGLSTAALLQTYNSLISVWVSEDLPVFFMPEEMEEIMDRLPTLSSMVMDWLGFVLLLNLILVVVAGGFITYRLAQPLLRVNKAIQDIGDGKLYTEINLGKGDDFEVLADSLNEAVTKIQLMVMTIDESLCELETMEVTGEDTERFAQVVANSKLALEYFETIDFEKIYENADGA